MLCWGSWANTQKLAGAQWRFELFYIDYSWGVLLCSVLVCLTLGSIESNEITFMDTLTGISLRKVSWAFAGGVIFNIANVLLVAAIAMSGMAVAFPVGIGLALIIGVAWNYMLNPQGNAAMLFGGVLLVAIAIIVDAVAYQGKAKAEREKKAAERVAAAEAAAIAGTPPPAAPKRVSSRTSSSHKKKKPMALSTKGLIVSLISGVLMGSFYPLVQISMSDEGLALYSYTASFFFAIGVMASSFLIVPILMNFPLHGDEVEFKAYFKGGIKAHGLGLLGGAIWFAGMIANLLASAAPKSANVGPAVSYALGQGATMISAFWGLFVWKEFAGASSQVRLLLGVMIVLFLAGLGLISLAPLY